MNAFPRGVAFTLAAGVALVASSSGAQTPAARVPAAPVAATPLSLDEAIRLAEGESEAVRIAQAGVLRARGQQSQARAQYLPQLNGSANYQRALQNQFQAISSQAPVDTQTGPRLSSLCAPAISETATPAERQAALQQAQTCASSGDALGGISRIFASPYTLTLGLTGSQTVYSGGRVQASNQVANATRRSAEIGVVAARAQLQLDVAQAYYGAVLADRLVQISESSYVQAERTYRQTSLASQVGNVAEFDLLRARVTRDNQRPVLIQARAARDVAYLQLRQLLNLPSTRPLALTTTLPIAGPSTSGPQPRAATAPSIAPSTAPERAHGDRDLESDAARLRPGRDPRRRPARPGGGRQRGAARRHVVARPGERAAVARERDRAAQPAASGARAAAAADRARRACISASRIRAAASCRSRARSISSTPTGRSRWASRCRSSPAGASAATSSSPKPVCARPSRRRSRSRSSPRSTRRSRSRQLAQAEATWLASERHGGAGGSRVHDLGGALPRGDLDARGAVGLTAVVAAGADERGHGGARPPDRAAQAVAAARPAAHVVVGRAAAERVASGRGGRERRAAAGRFIIDSAAVRGEFGGRLPDSRRRRRGRSMRGTSRFGRGGFGGVGLGGVGLRGVAFGTVALSAATVGACGEKDAAANDSTAAAAAVMTVGAENVAVVRTDTIQSGPGALRLAPARAAGDDSRRGGRHGDADLRRGGAARRARHRARAHRDDRAHRPGGSPRARTSRRRALGYETAQRNAERSDRLLAAGAIAARDAEGARAQASAAQAQLSAAQAQLASVQKAARQHEPERAVRRRHRGAERSARATSSPSAGRCSRSSIRRACSSRRACRPTSSRRCASARRCASP